MSVSVRFYKNAFPGLDADIDIIYQMGAVPRVGEEVDLDGAAMRVVAVTWEVDPDMYSRGSDGFVHVLVE